ncbi:MAG: ribonuclease HII [Synergistaceae bacterium]|nr:ribonuclease HII [Synergistaceae bacterium]
MIIAGVDEAGRGPLAGPVMTAAVILTPPQFRVLLSEGLNDSKKIPEKGRERIFGRIMALGVCWSAQAASHVRIDRTNILRATLWAMRLSVMSLGTRPDIVVVDGNILIPGIVCGRQIAVPRADSKVPAVMAASIVAKVLRDRVMMSLHRLYPNYGFASHKGYPTKAHREALDMLGPSPVHRLSFGGYNKNNIS